jgi:hypothetical protein
VLVEMVKTCDDKYTMREVILKLKWNFLNTNVFVSFCLTKAKDWLIISVCLDGFIGDEWRIMIEDITEFENFIVCWVGGDNEKDRLLVKLFHI